MNERIQYFLNPPDIARIQSEARQQLVREIIAWERAHPYERTASEYRAFMLGLAEILEEELADE